MKGRKTGGRQKGTPNKFSRTIKENLLAVFDQIGGTENMAKWAKENPGEFYRLYNAHKDSEKDAPGSAANPMHNRHEIIFPPWTPPKS